MGNGVLMFAPPNRRHDRLYRFQEQVVFFLPSPSMTNLEAFSATSSAAFAGEGALADSFLADLAAGDVSAFSSQVGSSSALTASTGAGAGEGAEADAAGAQLPGTNSPAVGLNEAACINALSSFHFFYSRVKKNYYFDLPETYAGVEAAHIPGLFCLGNLLLQCCFAPCPRFHECIFLSRGRPETGGSTNGTAFGIDFGGKGSSAFCSPCFQTRTENKSAMSLQSLPSKGICSQDAKLLHVDQYEVIYVHTSPNSNSTTVISSESAMEFMKRQQQRAQRMDRKKGLVELSAGWSEESFERPSQRVKY